MSGDNCGRIGAGTSPDGKGLAQLNLPPARTIRWVASRKAAVVTAVRSGAISLEEACSRYGLSTDEFLAWQMAFDRSGQSGLQIRRLQHHRAN
jgi:hypothetical protein